MAKVMVTVYHKLDHMVTDNDKAAMKNARAIVKNLPRENMMIEYKGCLEKLTAIGVV